jgi:DNA repair photolyase
VRRIDNPKQRFESQQVERTEPAPFATLEIHEEQAKSILSENDSPDIRFRYSLNPYRGCTHACAYCYARPSHQYWGFGAGTDFDRKIIVKVNAAELLRARFEQPDWRGETITFSGNTDCYQPLEAARRLTRACLEVCAEYRNPVALITKSSLIERDLDVLERLNAVTKLCVFVSIPIADDKQARALEPGASAPSKRFATLAALSQAGIETGLALAPIIVGLNDGQIPELLARARTAGAKHAFKVALRLPAEVAEVFETRLREAFPGSADKIMSGIHQIRRGKKNESKFGERMRGHGPRWQIIEDLFALHCRRLHLNEPSLGESSEPSLSTFRRPTAQLDLF